MIMFISNVRYYYDIVCSNYSEYTKLCQKYDDVLKDIELAKDIEKQETVLYEIEQEMDKKAMIVITFSQMTMESFCNAYLAQYKKLSVINKRNYFFNDRVNDTIAMIFKNNKVPKSKTRLFIMPQGYKTMCGIRNNLVHTLPVKETICLASDDKFQSGLNKIATSIEAHNLRRFKRIDIQSIANVYPDFLESIKETGCTFSDVQFDYSI